MSIQRMDSVLLVVPSEARDRFVNWLYQERQVHVREFVDTPGEWTERFSKLEKEHNPALVEAQVAKLQASIEILREFHKKPSDFLESLFPVRTITTMQEVEHAAGEVDPDQLFERCQELQHAVAAAQEHHGRIVADRARFEEFSFISQRLSVLKSLKQYAVRFVSASGQSRQFLEADDRVQEFVHLEPVKVVDSSTIYIMAAPAGDAVVMQELIADYTLRELVLPDVEGTIADAVTAADSELEEVVTREKALRQRGIEVAIEWQARAELALSAWESTHFSIAQEQYMMTSNNLFTVRGFIISKNRAGFEERLKKEFPGAEMEHYPIDNASEPPVSLAWNNFLRPAGLLVKMFGMPEYRSIDPTAFLTLSFLVFFGICFGDVLYGSMLIGVSFYLRKRFHDQRGLVEFFKLFTYAGVSTIIFGVLMGSWGADLPMYFGEGNPVDQLRLKLMMLDPLAKPIVALMIAVGIGMVNQLYGIVVRIYRDLNRNDVKSAIYDGVFWLTYLVSLLTACIGAAMGAPHAVIVVSLVIFGLSAVGLVLTQGRAEKSAVGRYITGLVSLYGIMGTYGTTAFLGDVISYSRLMALGLTTSVVGMSFNIIANMVRELPLVGIVLFVLVIVFGHIFNFVMSILSAFVHSARLILLEWFSRFYEGGGVPFQPYGFTSQRVDVVES